MLNTIKQINMARVMGTKRSQYLKDDVQRMRSERKTKKAKVAGVNDKDYQYYLGDLIGAGHLTIEGFNKIDTTLEPLSIGSTDNVVCTNITFRSLKKGDRDGMRPHLTGYLASGHPKDPFFKLKGWFNEDGSVRIELVK